MSAQFWPCPGCSRHVKRGDAICRFCGATASVDIGPTRVLAGRLSRAALFAAGAMGVGIATTDCNSAPLPPTETPVGFPAYGAPVVQPPPYDGGPPPTNGIDASLFVNETDDASARDAPGEVAADAGDAEDASATEPTDSSSADELPSTIVITS